MCVVTAGGNRRSCVSHGDRRRSQRGGRRSNIQDTQKPFKSLVCVCVCVCKVHVGGGWDGWGVRVRAHRRLAFVFPRRGFTRFAQLLQVGYVKRLGLYEKKMGGTNNKVAHCPSCAGLPANEGTHAENKKKKEDKSS